MNTTEQHKYLIERSGTNQAERALDFLHPDYFKVDDRSTSDMVKFVLDYSENLVYYNIDNKPEGTFRSVFEGDDTIDMLLLSSYEIQDVEERFNHLLNKYKSDSNPHELFDLYFNLFFQINSWSSAFENSRELKDEINHFIANEVVKVFAAFKKYIENINHNSANKLNFFPSTWLTASPVNINQTNDVLFFNRLFSSIKKLIKEMIHLGKTHLDKQLNHYHKINPQIALLLTYIDLYQEVKNEINKQTNRHLTHYYQEVLQFKYKKIIPDNVHLFPQIAQNRSNIAIPAGSSFPAGKDKNGKDIKYITLKEFIVSKVKAKKTLAICRDDSKPLPFEHSLIDFFHIPSSIFSPIIAKGYSKQTPGWAISHPSLMLKEGVRRISFKYNLERFSLHVLKVRLTNWQKQNDSNNPYELLLHAINVSHSNINGWINVPEEYSESKIIVDEDGCEKLVISVLLNEIDEPVTNFGDNIENENFGKELPVFKFHPTPSNSSMCNLFFDLIFTQVDIGIDVLGVKDFDLQNDFGQLDKTSPYQPFGPTPHIGSSFFIGHRTIFTHPLKELFINLQWYNTPDTDNGFAEYYNGYSYINSNTVFKTRISILNNKQWIPDDELQMVSLFEDVEMEDAPEITPINDFRGIDNIDIDKIQLDGSDSTGFNSFISKARSGWLKLELCYPPNGFGNKEYTELVKKSISEGIKTKKVALPPNEPWIPQLKELSIDYSTNITINFQQNNSADVTKFYHILPFGITELPVSRRKNVYLIDPIKEGGELYIGLENLEAPQSFNIFFKISDYISDYLPQDKSYEWYILNGSKWEIIEGNQIIDDETNGFIQSGYITFDINKSIDPQNGGMLPKGFTWIKLVVASKIYFFSNILDIQCEAITATFNAEENAISTGQIAPNLITASENFISGIVEIKQPYPSFGGRDPEDPNKFITRVSERLRHKNRMITIWDYEHLILEEFPEINRVKCIPNTNIDLKIKPGSVLNVVVPFIRNLNSASHIPVLPRNYLEKVRRFVQQKSSPFANVEVTNPIYEEVKLKFNVKFHKGLNYRHYTEVLQRELIRFFSPWLFDAGSQLDFGVSIRAASIIYFLEKLPYIDVVTNLSLLQIVDKRIIPKDLSQNSNVTIQPTTPISIFISSDRHIINVTSDELDELEGIEDMSLENDFILEGISEDESMFSNDGINNLTLGVDFILPGENEIIEEEQDCFLILKENNNG